MDDKELADKILEEFLEVTGLPKEYVNDYNITRRCVILSTGEELMLNNVGLAINFGPAHDILTYWPKENITNDKK